MTSTVTQPQAVIRRDRALVLSSLFGIAALSWLVTLYLGSGMGMMLPAGFSLTVALWIVMMVAMMTPSVSPTMLMFTGILRSRSESPFVRASIFLLGYLFIWSGFSIAAAVAQSVLSDAVSGTALFGGAALIAAGVFQFTPLKNACLSRCRSPQGFFMTEWREGPLGALVMGAKHGGYCLGCCWLLMLLLFVAGAMNIFWMAVLCIYILAEKVVPAGMWLSRAAGLVLVGAGAWIVVGLL